MRILGIYGNFHEKKDSKDFDFSFFSHAAGCSLWDNGVHIRTIEEERLTRYKHEGYISNSIDYVLGENYTAESIDAVCYVTGSGVKTSSYKSIYALLRKKFCKSKIYFINHHLAHSAAAFYTSNYSDALIFSNDSSGSALPNGLIENGMLSVGENNKIHVTNHYLIQHNEMYFSDIYFFISNFIIRLYELLNNKERDDILNYHDFIIHYQGSPGKIMGMSAYGDKNKIKHKLFQTKISEFGVTKKLNKKINNGKYSFYDLYKNYDFVDDFYKKYFSNCNIEDIAAWLQSELEENMVDYFASLPSFMKRKNLCISGGIGLNVLNNSNLINKGVFENVHVFPATNDGGLAFGGALLQVVKKEHSYSIPANLSSLGKNYSEQDILKSLEEIV
jgi:carbamoyltransferase